MPPDEGLALHEAGAARARAAGRRCSRSAATAASPSVYLGAAAARARHRAVRPRPPPGLRGEPARLGVARARPRRPGGRPHGHAAPLPPHGARRRPRGLGRGARRRLADRRPPLARSPLSLLFIDGGHGHEPAHRDYEPWTPWVAARRPARDPRRVPRPGRRRPPAVRDLPPGPRVGCLRRRAAQGSLRVLRRTAAGI